MKPIDTLEKKDCKFIKEKLRHGQDETLILYMCSHDKATQNQVGYSKCNVEDYEKCPFNEV